MDSTETLRCHICDVTMEDDVSVIKHMVTTYSNNTTGETHASGIKKIRHWIFSLTVLLNKATQTSKVIFFETGCSQTTNSKSY